MAVRAGFVLLAFAALPQFAQQDSEAQKLINASDCSSCHAADHDVVGPAYASIAKKYAGQSDAAGKLAVKIRDGGGGMTAHPELSDPQRTAIARWILSQQQTSAPAEAKSYSYAGKDGAAITLDFPLFVEGAGRKVTKDVFHGYQLYNSYCYRCHGTDATGGQLAPDLRHSLGVGMKQRDFLAVAMEGRKEQGMPSWAGFLSEAEMTHIYRYVKARSLDLVATGRPPSEQD